ncbi:MAG: UTP--glucose-1-phosphate uridylyltransferase [Deltaproteobacteria bacterium]|nr:UTP--glucose-1-phosphate uridylyltransferase [Deltaproteobacteria bacterium]
MRDFAASEQKMRAAGLPDLAIRAFRRNFESLLAGDNGTLPKRDIDAVADVPQFEETPALRKAGEDALPHAVVIKLNGGLGTTMGMTQAKSLLPVKNGLTFLDVIALQIRALAERTRVAVPLVLMNSFRTQADSLAALAKHGQLSGALAPDFMQHKVPRLLASDLSPVSWQQEPEHEWCPPGHGDLYTALVTSGSLERMLARGLRYAFVSNSDNLGAALDLGLLGWFASSGAPFAMEVKRRAEADKKGGHLARTKNGRLALRETAQCPSAADEVANFQDTALHKFFNTNNLWIDLRALARALDENGGVLPLPFIRNEKNVDPLDATSPRVIQLETAMGAAIACFEGARAIQVPAHRFAPVKSTGDLLAIRSDAYVLSDDYRVLPAPGGPGDQLVVDLDPTYFKRVDQLDARTPHGPPSLIRARRLTVRGDYTFAKGEVCEGECRISS